MRNNFSRKTFESYIYLKKKKTVINNKSADMQVHMMKASNNKNLFQKLVLFFYIFWLTKIKGLDWTRINWKWLNVKVYE